VNPDHVEPLTADLRRFHLTVSRRFLGKLKDAKELRSNASPDATSEEVLEAALDLLLATKARQRGHGAKPRPARAEQRIPAPAPAPPPDAAARSQGPALAAAAGSRAPALAADAEPHPRASAVESPGESRTAHVPNDVKRAVWARDGGCCQWPLASGGVCGSRRRIQFDHREPRARGGLATVANVRLLCRFHNDEAARLVLGDAWMDRFTRGPPLEAPARG
jgi:hypothetical protein